MGDARPFLPATTVVSIVLLLFGIGTINAEPDRPDPHKPVSATDITLAKKITLRGGRPPGVGGGSKKAGAATGLLGSPCGGAKYAIAVGISDYPGQGGDLEYADDDADEMALVLMTLYGFSSVTTLKDGQATRAAILAAIEALELQAGPQDEVVFFFSGHGMNGIAEDGDSEKRDEAVCAHDGTNFVPIWDGELKSAFSGFATNRITFIFDICFAGGMDDLQESGREVLMASGEKSYSYEGDRWQNGEFTYYFAEIGIRAGEANIHDYNGNGDLSEPTQVTMEEAFDYAKANCDRDRPVITDEFADDLLP